MEQELLNKAISLGCNVYQNSLGKWVIKGFINKKIWILQEQQSNAWLMTFDELSQVYLETEKTLEALDMLTRYQRT